MKLGTRFRPLKVELNVAHVVVVPINHLPAMRSDPLQTVSQSHFLHVLDGPAPRKAVDNVICVDLSSGNKVFPFGHGGRVYA